MSDVSLLAFVADTHTNSISGLNPPSLHRELGGKHYAGKVGRTLWRHWLEFWRVIEAKRVEHNATVYAFAVGDLGDINKHSSVQLITSNEIDILDAMAEVAEPMAAVADRVFIIRGTEAHTGGNGKLEELLARDLDNAVRRCEDVASWWIVDAKIAGLRVMATHHPPTGSGVPWTLDPAAARAANYIFSRYADADLLREKPDVCVWAHLHSRGAEGHGQGDTWGIFLPSWQLPTSFAHRIGAAAGPCRVGGLWMLVKDGKVLEWDWLRWRMRSNKPWTEP